jgi:hypothetical protein
LYVEYLTDKIIKFVVPKTKSLKKLKLGFSGKVNLLIALGVDSDIEKPLLALSAVRNKFAHQPNYKLDKSVINNLYDALTSSDKELLHTTYGSIRLLFPEIIGEPNFKNLKAKEQFVLIAIAIRSVVKTTLD